MDRRRLGKFFLIRVLGGVAGDLVLQVRNGTDMPGIPVVTGQAVDEAYGNDHQLWFYDQPSKTIRCKMNYYCMTEKADMVVCSPFIRGSENQRWVISSSSIQMEQDFEAVLGVPEEGLDEPGTEVCILNDDGSAGRNFSLEHRPATFFFIRSQQNEGKVMDVYKAEKKAGGKVICWQDKGTLADNQLWYEDETGVIRSKLNGFAIDAGAKDLELQPYEKNSHLQQWVIHGNLIQSRVNNKQVLEYRPAKMGLGFLAGDWVVREQYKGTTAQMWLFEPVPDSASSMNHTGLGKFFFMRNRLTGLVLGLQDGKTSSGTCVVTAYRNEEAADQLFYVDELTGTIRSKAHDYCLDGSESEAKLGAFDAYSKLQQWKISGYKIENRQDSKLVLQSQDGEPDETGSYQPGSYVTFGEPHADSSGAPTNQQWEITHLPARPFYIRSVIKDNVMDVTKDEASAGAKIILWNKKPTVSDNQLWFEDERGIIRSKLSGYVIQADGKSACAMPFDPSNQKHFWMIVGDKIQNKYKRDEVLDIKGITKMKYSGIGSAKFNGGESQQWRFDYV